MFEAKASLAANRNCVTMLALRDGSLGVGRKTLARRGLPAVAASEASDWRSWLGVRDGIRNWLLTAA